MRDHDIRQGVLFFVKAPQKGTVKTRLAETVGDDVALALYRSFVGDMLAMLATTDYPVRIYFTPAEAENQVRQWLGDKVSIYPQTGRDLGEKMKNALAETFAAGFDRAILIGSDLPDLPAIIIDESFDALAHSPTVIGPCLDGGYYLIGFTKDGFLPDIFDDIAWSSGTVLSGTGEHFRDHDVRPYVLPAWLDVDAEKDLVAFVRGSQEFVGRSPRTMACLRENGLMKKEGVP
jgi:uncharacterized protein